MNIRFKHIDIENFKSLEKISLDLENQGTVIVKGVNEYENKATSNGSGKSSIFESIIYALFEETSSGEKDVANRIINNGFYINLTFDIDGINYGIIRQQKNGKSNVILYKNDIDISARNKTDTNKLIAQLLGINKSIFLDSIFLSQNANNNLASLAPSARKERLEILTNTDYMINNFKDKLKEQQNIYETKCVENKMSINKLEGSKSTNIQQLNNIQHKIDKIQLELDKLNNLGSIDEIEKQISYIENVELVELLKSIENLDNEISNKELEITKLRDMENSILVKKAQMDIQKQDKLKEWNEIDKKILDKNNMIWHKNNDNIRLDKEIDKIKHSDTCPTCGRKYENANEEHITNTIKGLLDEKNINQRDISSLQIELDELNKKQEEVVNQGKLIADDIVKVMDTYNEQKLKIDNVDFDRKKLINSKQQFEKEQQMCRTKIDELKNKKEEILKIQINNIQEYENMINNINLEIENIDNQICEQNKEYEINDNYVNVIKNSIQLVTKEFRTYLLQNSLKYLNHLLEKYSKDLFSNLKDKIQILDDDTKLNIVLGDASYESLSGGERTRVNIALLLAQKSLAESIGNISCNIIILDEILGFCDSQAEENVINLIINELETLESIYMVSHKEIPIGYDSQLIVVKNKDGLSRVMCR